MFTGVKKLKYKKMKTILYLLMACFIAGCSLYSGIGGYKYTLSSSTATYDVDSIKTFETHMTLYRDGKETLLELDNTDFEITENNSQEIILEFLWTRVKFQELFYFSEIKTMKASGEGIIVGYIQNKKLSRFNFKIADYWDEYVIR